MVTQARKTVASAQPATKPAAKSVTKIATKPAAKPKALLPAPGAKAAAKTVKASVATKTAKSERTAKQTNVAKPVKPVKASAQPASKPAADKAARVKLVRDSFTMPDFDFALIDQLKARAMTAKRHAKKSELLRAGLQALAALSPAQLAQALERLAPVKTGRPKKGH